MGKMAKQKLQKKVIIARAAAIIVAVVMTLSVVLMTVLK